MRSAFSVRSFPVLPRLHRLLAHVLLALLCVVAATSSSAVPLYFTGPGGFGTDSVSALAAADPALPDPLEILDLDNATPGRLSGTPEAFAAAGPSYPALDCSDSLSDPSSCIALRLDIQPLTIPNWQHPADPSLTPIEGTSTWEITNTTGRKLTEAFLVLSSSEGAPNIDQTLVGIDTSVLDDYLLIKQTAGGTPYYFVAIDLDLPQGGWDPDDSVLAEIHYYIKDSLIPIPNSDDYRFPRLVTEAVVVAVPEPGTFLLFASGLVGFAALRRR